MSERREKRGIAYKTAPFEKFCMERECPLGLCLELHGIFREGRFDFDRSRNAYSSGKGRKDKVSGDAYQVVNWFFGYARGMWKVLGQGSNLCHRSNPSHCSDSAGFLTTVPQENSLTLCIPRWENG